MELDTPKIYEPIVDLDSLKERLQSFLQQYNEATRGGDVDLVFFKVCVIENFNTKLNRYFKKAVHEILNEIIFLSNPVSKFPCQPSLSYSRFSFFFYNTDAR